MTTTAVTINKALDRLLAHQITAEQYLELVDQANEELASSQADRELMAV